MGQCCSKRRSAVLPEGYEKITLTSNEHGAAIILNPAVGTQNFYKGSIVEAEKFFRKRYRDVINANPWLAGRLVHDNSKPAIIYPSTVSDALFSASESDGSLLRIHPTNVNINPDMDILTMSSQAAKCDIPWGYAAIGDPNSPLARLVLVACRNEDGTPADTASGGSADFCVLFFVSHLAGDGHTYYRLLSMLSSELPVESLNAQRKFGYNEDAVKLLGYDGIEWSSGAFHVMNWMYSMLLGKKPVNIFTVYVDHEQVAEEKAKVKAAVNPEVAFVSTNDVLMSSLGKLVDARLSIIAMNLRERIPGVFDSDAGNYDSLIIFDQKVYSSPVGIRKVMNAINAKKDGSDGSSEPVKTFQDPLPGVMSSRTAKLVGTSNWATFHEDVVVPGCEEVLHSPGGDFASILDWCGYETVVVY